MRLTQSKILHRAAGVAGLLLSATPAFAGTGLGVVPEPNVVTLLTLASAGVLVGRRMSSRKPPQD